MVEVEVRSTTLAAGVACFAPRYLFAAPDNLVGTARTAAAAGSIAVQKLRGNVSVLMGAGGNIAVLPGRDGKLLIDAGYVGARPKISDALATINPDPTSSTHTGTLTTLTATSGGTMREQPSQDLVT